MKTTTSTTTQTPKLKSRNQVARSANHDSQPVAPAPGQPVQADAEAPAWRGVFFDGPEPEQDRRSGDEIPVWSVYVGDDEGIPVGRVYRVFSFTKAEALAMAMAKDRQLELITEAMPADMNPAQVAEPVAA